MKAVVFKGNKEFVVEDIPKPKPGKGEILLKPLYVGLCFSDREMYEVSSWGGWVQGHEWSGVVEEVGPGVEGWKKGDRVAVNPTVYCGECINCRAGFQFSCLKFGSMVGLAGRRESGEWYNGGLAEYAAVPAYTCYKVADMVSDLAAQGAEVLCCALRAVRNSGMVIGDNVVILGGEDMELSALQWAKIAGAKRVVLADPVKIRREMAKKLGADFVFDPTDKDFVNKVRELMPHGADVVFMGVETIVPGSFNYFFQAGEIARMQGHIELVRSGGVENPFPKVSWAFAGKEITFKGCGVWFGDEPWRGGRDRGDFQLTVEYLNEKKVDAETWVTKVVDFFKEVKTADDVRALYERLPEKECKIVYKIWGK